MDRKRSLAFVVLRNVVLFIVSFLIVSSFISWAQWSTTKYHLEDTYVNMLKLIREDPHLQSEANKSGMTYEEYAWYLTYRTLNVKPSFISSMKMYYLEIWKIMWNGLDTWGSPWTYVRNTVVIFILAAGTVFVIGLYLGLRAGYNGGKLDQVVSILAPFFSAIPSWFVGALLFLLFWNVGYLPDFQIRLQEAIARGRVGATVYLAAYLGPIITVFISMVFEYAFMVRNLISQEKREPYIIADKAKGIPEGRIQRKVLRAVLPPFLTYTTYNFLEILTAVLVVEIVFDVKGIGYLLLVSFRVVYEPPGGIYLHFYPQLLMFVSLTIMLLHFFVSTVLEWFYINIDPRLSEGM